MPEIPAADEAVGQGAWEEAQAINGCLEPAGMITCLHSRSQMISMRHHPV
jgi:hypothetical protein